MNPDWEITRGYICGYVCTWPGVQDWSRLTPECRPQGVAGRSPADQPQTEPEGSEMIHFIHIPGRKKKIWPKQSDLLRVRRTGRWRRPASFPHRPGNTKTLVRCMFLLQKPKLHSSHWRSPWPSSAWACPVCLRSFLGGQKRSEETETSKVGINVLLGSLFEPLQISAQLFYDLKAITS